MKFGIIICHTIGGDDEEESAMASADDQRESDFQVYTVILEIFVGILIFIGGAFYEN